MMIAVRRTSRRFIEVTLVFLLFVALLPWPTALVAEFIDQHRAARVVTVLYSTNMLFIALALSGSWAYLSRRQGLIAPDLEGNFRASLPRTTTVCIPYLIAILVAFFSPLASLFIDGAVVLYLAISSSPLERAEAGSLGAAEEGEG
jgi:uncharacterized membrane protein